MKTLEDDINTQEWLSVMRFHNGILQSLLQSPNFSGPNWNEAIIYHFGKMLVVMGSVLENKN